MCGINGFNWEDPSLIKNMNQAIEHRGPDGNGIEVADGVSLGHVRLSIIDLSINGSQPMAEETGDTVIVYNGEIYNYKEIRSRLVEKGYSFNSETDTEVILNAYKEFGTDTFKLLNGIFAFCIFDKKTKLLYLVRDCLGIKPLYYYFREGNLVFSSEVKSFCLLEEYEFHQNDEAISEYLLTSGLLSESLITEVKPLPAGHYMSFQCNRRDFVINPYLIPEDLIAEEKYHQYNSMSEKRLVDELDYILNETIKSQLVSDAPIGTVCSGGLDSSLVTAIASKYKEDLQVFNIKVDDSRFDESMYAEAVTEHLQLKLHQIVLTKELYLSNLNQAVYLNDHPPTHPNCIGTFILCNYAKQKGISVLLNGDGADELFGGYHRYKSFSKKVYLNRLHVLSLFQFIAGGLNREELLSFHFTSQPPFHFTSYLGNDFITERLSKEKTFFEKYTFIENLSDRTLKAFMAKDLYYYLKPILNHTDRMSMGSSVEMRVPYLDKRLLDFSLNLPVRYMFSPFTSKYLLKRVAERYLPSKIVYRKKRGFPIPINQWLGTADFKLAFTQVWKDIFYDRFHIAHENHTRCKQP